MLFSYALNHLKKHKKQSIELIAFMTFFLTVLLSIQIYASSKKGIETLQKKNNYGEWQVYIDDWDVQQDISKLTEDIPYVILYDRGHLEKKARFSYTNGYKLYAIEGDYEKTIALHLVKGRLPQNDNEIVISKSELSILGFNTDLNQSIRLSLEDGMKDFCLVGITDYIEDDETRYYYPRYLVAPGDYSSTCLFLGGQKNNDFIDTLSFEKGNDIYRSNATINFYGKNIISTSMQQLLENKSLVGILVLTSICSGLVMMNLSYASSKKREQEYVLLRGMGATKKQLYLLSIIESSMLLLVSMILALPLSFAMSLIFLNQISFTQIQLFITSSMLITTILLATVIIIYSCFHPVSKAISLALTGSFDAQDEPLMHASHKKMKTINLRKLAFRHLYTHLKDTVMMIILLAIALLIASIAVSSIQKNEMLITNLGTVAKKQNCSITRDYDNRLNEKDINNLLDAGISVSLIDVYQLNEINDSSIVYEDDISLPFSKERMEYDSLNFIPITENVKTILEYYHFTGVLPQIKNEVLINMYTTHLADDNDSLKIDTQKKHIQSLKINHENYIVTGMTEGILVPSHQFEQIQYYFPLDYNRSGNYLLYLLPSSLPDNAFPKYQIVFMKYSGTNKYNWLQDYFENDYLDGPFTSYVAINELINEYQDKIDYASLVGSCLTIVLIIMSYIIHIKRVSTDHELIIRYRLLGMTKKEIVIFYIWQGLLISSLSVLITACIAINSLPFFKGLSFMSIASLICIVMTILNILYVMPVLLNISNSTLQSIQMKEGQ